MSAVPLWTMACFVCLFPPVTILQVDAQKKKRTTIQTGCDNVPKNVFNVANLCSTLGKLSLDSHYVEFLSTAAVNASL